MTRNYRLYREGRISEFQLKLGIKQAVNNIIKLTSKLGISTTEYLPKKSESLRQLQENRIY